MHRFLIAISLTLLMMPVIEAQTSRDKMFELKAELDKSQTDTGRVRILCAMSSESLGDQTDVALEYAREALKMVQKIDQNDIKADVYVKMGICFYYQYVFDSALHYYKLALEIHQQNQNVAGIATIEMNIGLVFHNQSDYPEAISHYSSSLEHRKKLNDKTGMADCYNNIGAVYYAQGNFEKALENYFNSLNLCEELGRKDLEIILLTNIGGIYEAQGKFDKALEFHNRAFEMAKATNNTRMVANTCRNIGCVLIEKQSLDSAMMMFEDALEIYLDQNDILEQVISYNSIGQLLVLQNEKKGRMPDLLEKANSYFQKGLDLNLANVNDLDALCVSYQGLGEVKEKKGEYLSSITYFNKSLQIADEIKSGSNLKMIYERLSKVYSLKGDYKNAYFNHVQFKNWSDSLKSDEKIEMITQMAMQHEFDKQKEIQEVAYQQKLKRQKLIRTFILSGFVIVLLFSLQMLRSYQRKKRDNILLEQQKAKIEKQKEEITDSIKYAKRIQTAILPSHEFVSDILPDHFILFRPRDIVSGDYYWLNKVGNQVVIVAADCTGHGVPGAFMSMLGVSFLNEIINRNHELIPAEILNQLRDAVKRTLGQTGKDGEAKDGMDIALCVLDLNTMELQYAGAYNPLYVYRKGELMEYKADKMPIGIYVKEKESFTNNLIKLEKGDTFYIFSDGYVDQFGGATGGKFKTKAFKELLAEIQPQSMQEQRKILNENIDNWRGPLDQVDDIIVLGVRV